MERRKFIKQSSLGLSAFFLLPGFVNESFANVNAINSELLSLHSVPGQIRHGALHLPQVGFNSKQISFDWLQDISRNIFFQNGFIKGKEEEDMEVTSILLKPSATTLISSIQIQSKAYETILLLGDQEYTQKHAERGLQFLISEGGIDLQFGSIEANQIATIQLDQPTELFVYLLNGKMTINGITLKRNKGLGLKEINSIQLNCQEESQLIWIQKKNKTTTK